MEHLHQRGVQKVPGEHAHHHPQQPGAAIAKPSNGVVGAFSVPNIVGPVVTGGVLLAGVGIALLLFIGITIYILTRE